MMSWLESERQRLDISVTDVARYLGVSRPTYYRYRDEPGVMSLAQVMVLARRGFLIPGLSGDVTLKTVTCPRCQGSGRIEQLVSATINV